MIFCLFLFLCCKDNTKKWIKSNILQEKWTNGDKNIFFYCKKMRFYAFILNFDIFVWVWC